MSFLGAFGSNDGTEQRVGASPHTSFSNQHMEQEIANERSEAATRLRSPSHPHAAPDHDAKPAEAVDDEKSDSEDSESQSDEARFRQVTSLARQYTNASHYSAIGKNPFTEAEPDSSLDPNGANFNARAWAKALLHIQSRDPEKHPERTAGIAYKNLNVFGYGNATDYQKSVGNVLMDVPGLVNQVLGKGQRRIDILRDFEGLVEAGEMLVVLGPPGSGCSTLLKTISGETHGFNIDKSASINYQGISAHDMHNQFRGEAIYTAEVDVHFPNMTVGDTLAFAARARAPRNTPGDVDSWTYANHMRDVVMAMYGISHTINTRVGNDFVRGVSGGERKRVSIAEATLSQAPLQCWDNSTRGLDSANAIEFCKTLRMQTDLMGCTACVAIYQAPQAAFDTFDKVVVLYEGRQIYFGRCEEARQYFLDMGFECPDRQTTADFLTSMTSAIERVVRPGWEDRVPRTPDEFAARWKESQARAQLIKDIDEYNQKYAIGGEYLEKFKQSRKAQQSKGQRIKSPYTLSYAGQVKLCLWRGFRRLTGDPSLTFSQMFGNTIMALILGSVFYNLADDASSFFSRGALLFFAVLFNAFGSALEILTLYAQRPIVEKQARYAMYHPSAEAFASMLTDLPYKIGNAICFNLILYFMTNLRREPGAFFFFLLISFVLTLVMSMLFRTIGSVSRTLSQAMAPTAVLILALVIYTGFVIPTRYMLGWSRWINYLDPISYGFESLMINEFHNRNFTCTTFIPDRNVPGYEDIGPLNQVCSSTGAQPGQSYVDGDAFINSSYAYYHAHKWRNLGIEFAFMIGLCCAYLAATEFISAKKSKGEVLVFRRGYVPATAKMTDDIESAPAGRAPVSEKTDNSGAIIQRQTAIFHWEDMCYDIKIKNEERRILDHVDGWVKPGTLTALMGVSGAGKTTLLDVLATRVTMGVISGNAMVDGRERDDSFQRKTGYVQQQDLHLQTSTVREALNFSAQLRQPADVPREEKLAYVDEVIKLLEMQEYADAVVGVPGEGLNVEQRKRLTIGVELAAKPQLLLFLDEPTSGLDSQTSWAICDLMEKLTKNGQAILCTIHQPSAMLFQRFDRLLFLAKGGRTVYFGDIGKNSKVLTSYFERNGAFPCPDEANPAEWMLEVIGAAPGTHTEIDWHQAWRDSAEYQGVKDELRRMKEELPQKTQPSSSDEKASFREFAAPFGFQLWEVTKRVFEQYWRTPSYIYSKLALVVASGLFVGFSFFKALNTTQGLQNQMFAIFMLMTIFGNLVQQIMPHFVTQRALYEVRERPSKTYSWKAFMLSQIIVELPWNTLAAVLLFFTWYYPIGLYRNSEPTGAVNERGALMFLFIWAFLMFTSTFADMVIAGIETAENGGNIANLLFMLTLIFSGVLATKEALPGFWIFMYYMSPFTYLVSGMLSTAVSGSTAQCADNEFLHFDPTDNQTCGQYMEVFKTASGGGYTLNPEATSDCQYCAMSSTDQFLSQVDIYFNTAWRNFGLMWIYIVFNVFAALFIYWLGRVPKKPSKKKQA